MKIRNYLIFIIVSLLLSIGMAIFIITYKSSSKINLIELNDVVQLLINDWDTLDENNLPGLDYEFEYVVLDEFDKAIFATEDDLNTNINLAIKNRDTIIDIKSNDTILGKLIIYNDTDLLLVTYQKELLLLVIIFISITSCLCTLYFVYINISIIKPFRKLQGFSRNVAQGNLELPLQMDKANLFGAFSESFDLMRSELSKAKENERKANQSKKELVASLSHDIKTPIASIKAVSELMVAKYNEKEVIQQLEIVIKKADQIDSLISNLFNSTLEELQELNVSVNEESSQLINNLVKVSDYKQQINISSIPECLILIDVLRLEQVVDNIINNSYKYSGTKIDVVSRIEDGFLEIDFNDYGQGVRETELALVFNKYFRANNSSNKNGAGLGLYISRFLITKMSGDIIALNNEYGFTIRLKLLIV